MTDYKNLKLIASSSPHIHSVENTRSIMLDVIIAMLPALFWAIYNFGFKALLSVVVSVVACLFWEWLYRKLLKKPQSIGDLSAVVTGMLLAFVCPPELPWWALVIGAFFSIVVVKQLYGGIGCNFLNPALAGRAILLASYATAMTTWSHARRPAASSSFTWASAPNCGASSRRARSSRAAEQRRSRRQTRMTARTANVRNAPV